MNRLRRIRLLRSRRERRPVPVRGRRRAGSRARGRAGPPARARSAARSRAGTAAARCRSGACAITASCSGFGIPLRFVLPSAASENIVSISDSNCSAGRISHTKCATSSPAFQNLCGVPAGTVRRLPGPATSSSRPTLKPTVPREHLEALLLASGGRAPRRRSRSAGRRSRSRRPRPFVSRRVRRKTRRSPVTGFSMESPARIMLASFWIGRWGGCRWQPGRSA